MAEGVKLLDFSQDLAMVGSMGELETVIQRTLSSMDTIEGYSISKISPGSDHSQTIMEYHRLGRGRMAQGSGTLHLLEDGLQNRVLGGYIPLRFHVQNEINRNILSAYPEKWGQLGYDYVIGMALRHADRELGILWLASGELDFSFIKSLGAMISTALVNIWSQEELQMSRTRHEYLLAFGNEIAGIREFADLKKAVTRWCQGLFGSQSILIHGLERDGESTQAFWFESFMEQGERIEANLALHPLEPHLDRVWESPEPLNLDLDPDTISLFSQGSKDFKVVDHQKMYGASLAMGNRPLGVLWLVANQVDPELLKIVASQISRALYPLIEKKSPKDILKTGETHQQPAMEQRKPIGELIGQSQRMAQVHQWAAAVAPTNSTVLILGETGTGKGLLAQAIHHMSHRKDGPMVKVNCGAIPTDLIESELFGHEKGAFTGAVERRIGKFEQAHKGTLFLDEIGEMPLGAQIKLLRVLQERELERIGGLETIKIDVRIIAATHRDLEQEIREDRFRQDLYYRLNVFPIQLPPLRERMEDIEGLAHFFLRKYARSNGKENPRLSPKALQQLHAHNWPGNVRELEHLVERSVLLARDGVIREIQIKKVPGPTGVFHSDFVDMTLEELERTFIRQILKRCRGKISGPGGAAEILGIPGNTLHSKMKKLSISRVDHTPDSFRPQHSANPARTTVPF